MIVHSLSSKVRSLLMKNGSASASARASAASFARNTVRPRPLGGPSPSDSGPEAENDAALFQADHVFEMRRKERLEFPGSTTGLDNRTYSFLRNILRVRSATRSSKNMVTAPDFQTIVGRHGAMTQ